jgi:hypothetical protein
MACFLVDYSLMQAISGPLCAIGLGYVLKWIPFKKQILKE